MRTIKLTTPRLAPGQPWDVPPDLHPWIDGPGLPLKAPDAEITRQLYGDRDSKTVRDMRIHLGYPSILLKPFDIMPWFVKAFEQLSKSDAAIAKESGCSTPRVALAREQMMIPAWKRGGLQH